MTRAWLLLLAVLLLGASAGPPRYDRAQWEHWIDADGDCQDTRQEVLIRDARPGTVQLDARGCRVVAGTWLDPYTGRVFTDPSLLDVDHVLPLHHVHHHGGARWPAEQKRSFANFLDYSWHLRAVDRHANREKGAKGPEAWLPSHPQGRCRYLEAWSTIKVAWGLSFSAAERRAIRAGLAGC